jgi:rSAM/selenodomain-associated transferase 2
VISAIVLVLNEEDRLSACLTALAGQSPHESIVVDGGSSDGSVGVAQAAGAHVIVSERGRALQANRGARASAGDVLLFLHADTVLAPGALELIERTLAEDPDVVGGSFTLRFDDPRVVFRLFAAVGGVYHRFSRSLYGDRGIFVRRDVFQALGGFRPLPVMEDYDFGRRLRRVGRIRILRRAVVSSAREFTRQGPWRLAAKIPLCILAFRLGVSPQRIRSFYYGPAGRTPETTPHQVVRATDSEGSRHDDRRDG